MTLRVVKANYDQTLLQVMTDGFHFCLKTDFPELTAIVRLLLARIAIRMNRFDEAEYHLHEFERINLPEHAWIQRLHQKVFSEFSHQDHLVLREDQLTQKEAYLELKKFLGSKG